MNSKSFITLPRWHRLVIKSMTVGLVCFFVFAVVLFLLYDPGEPYDKRHYITQFIIFPTLSQLIIVSIYSSSVKFLEKKISDKAMTAILSVCITLYLGVMVGAHNSVPEMAILLIYPIFGATIYNSRLIMVMQSVVSIAVYTLIKAAIVPNINNFMPVNTGLTYFIIFIGLAVGAVIISFMLRKMSVEIMNNSDREKNLLRIAAKKDRMTNLYNHSTFHEILEEKIRQYSSDSGKGTFSLLIFDIDNFKSVNDTFGHAAGDRIILKAAEIISSDIRESDIAFRYGGEEFAVIAEEADENTARSIAERIVSDFYSLSPLESFGDRSFSLSCGIAVYRKGEDTQQSLFNAADKALYYVKNNGKNEYAVFSDVHNGINSGK